MTRWGGHESKSRGEREPRRQPTVRHIIAHAWCRVQYSMRHIFLVRCHKRWGYEAVTLCSIPLFCAHHYGSHRGSFSGLLVLPGLTTSKLVSGIKTFLKFSHVFPRIICFRCTWILMFLWPQHRLRDTKRQFELDNATETIIKHNPWLTASLMSLNLFCMKWCRQQYHPIHLVRI